MGKIGAFNKIIYFDEVPSNTGTINSCTLLLYEQSQRSKKPVRAVLDTALESSVFSCYEVK